MSVGLDIGSKSVKMVELSREGLNWRLNASGIVAYKGRSPEDAENDKELAPLAESVKKLHKEAKISSKQINLSLPEPQVYTRTVKFPLLSDSEIASAVKWEAEQFIPIPVDEAVIQHQVIEKRKDATPPQAVVLLIAAPIKLVEKYARVVEMAGLSLAVIETELTSLIRSLAPDNQTVLVVDFGAKSTDIAVSRSAQLMFTRSIPTAGDAFTRAISQTLGIENTQAEEYKKTYGLSKAKLEGKIETALIPVFKMVTDEMKKAIQYYQSEEKGDVPRSVLLAGGTSGMPEISSTLTKLLGIEVVVGNPFAKVNVDPDAVKSLTGYAPLYAVAVGLAMREV